MTDRKEVNLMRYAFGVDIGGTTVKLGLFDQDANVLKKWEIPTRKENGGEQILPDVAASILQVMSQMNMEKEAVIGVGVGAPGPVDDAGVIERALNLGWGVFNLSETLEKLLDLPVKSGNDANVAAFGEMWQGGGKGYKDLVVVTLGTGVGGGIIINSKILTGANGAAGEVGHIQVEKGEAEVCNCGNTGCLEQYASATGIAMLAARRLKKDNTPSILRSKPNVSAKTVFDAVKQKDAVAIEIAQQFGEYLGRGLAAIAAVVNPEVFVIGGGVSKAGEILFDYIEPVFRKNVFHACSPAKLKLATLGNDAGIYGAAALFLLNQ